VSNRPKTIFRVAKNKDNPYVMIDKRPLENPSLSWKAKGVLAYLLSRPDDWEIILGDLIKRSTDGESAVRSALKELRKVGHVRYLARERIKGQVGKAIWEVHEVPLPDSENHSQVEPNGDFPNVDKPNVENLPHTNNDSTNNESTKSNGADARKAELLKKMPASWKILHDQPVTPGDLARERKETFKNEAREVAGNICHNLEDGIPLAMAFMLARGILLYSGDKAKSGHRMALRQMLDAKPRRVQPEHITQAVQDLKNNNLTVKDLFSVVGTAIDLANPMPGATLADDDIDPKKLEEAREHAKQRFTK